MNNFLVSIGASICRKQDDKPEYVLPKVKDKVVQDADDSEGTGTWTVQDAAELHVSIGSIAAAHFFRVASAYSRRRESTQMAYKKAIKASRFDPNDKDKLILNIKEAVSVSFLLSYCQGLHMIAKANKLHKWEIDCSKILQLWRGGCIIRSDMFMDMFEQVYKSDQFDDENLLSHPFTANLIAIHYEPLKNVVASAIQANAPIPSLSASLEYCKYMGSTDLPTQFMEAELDYFGAHMFELKSENEEDAQKGKHHFEWKQARGINEDQDGI
jgi:6-phosphogluconate dehydrogenase